MLSEVFAQRNFYIGSAIRDQALPGRFLHEDHPIVQIHGIVERSTTCFLWTGLLLGRFGDEDY